MILERETTLEAAADTVAKMREVDEDEAIELFCHYDDVFKLNSTDGKAIIRFAQLCGYDAARNVRVA